MRDRLSSRGPTAFLFPSALLDRSHYCLNRDTRLICRVDSLGKTLVILGLALAGVGALVWLLGRHGHGGGLLPGDIAIERKGVHFYFPVVTCLVASALLSLIAWLVRR